MRAPRELGSILHSHYDKFKHEVSGQHWFVQYLEWVIHVEFIDVIDGVGVCWMGADAGLHQDLLQQDYWVPSVTSRQDSARFSGKEQWREILQNTGECCLLWATRMTQEPLRLCCVSLLPHWFLSQNL